MNVKKKYPIYLYNTLSKSKEIFEPVNENIVGMYVCGPTVYSDVHLGNIRTFLNFDTIFRYLKYIGYKVRYVRNITDVGHLENDSDEGEDKIAKKAKLEQLEPMEVVQKYTHLFHQVLNQFNILPPSIEPSATAHIIEQIAIIEQLVEKKLGYTVNGSVYFDVTKYNHLYNYGKLSNRKIEDLIESGRTLDNQEEKRNNLDFALWKRADAYHIMQWDSPWGKGYPGWHLECTAMSKKYLGEKFDIHGGGLDLVFPHHECEIAQSVGINGIEPAKYWLHSNMLVVNGQKMSKSLGNSFLPQELFDGSHHLLDKGYNPMVVRFFMLQSHYRSTLNISNKALQASSIGYDRLIEGYRKSNELEYSQSNSKQLIDETVNKYIDNLFLNMSDDFNTAKTLAVLFDMTTLINNFHSKKYDTGQLTKPTFEKFIKYYQEFIRDVLGLLDYKYQQSSTSVDINELINFCIGIRNEARSAKNFVLSDKIRDGLKDLNITINDGKDKTTYTID